MLKWLKTVSAKDNLKTYMGVVRKVHVMVFTCQGQHETPRTFFSWVRECINFGEGNGERLSWWSGLSGKISYFPRWSESLLSCYWQAENRPKHYIVIKWSWTPNHDSGCGLLEWFAKDCLRKSRESSTKAVAKEKASMEASSPHSTFAVASQGNMVNNETLLFPGGIFPT